MKTTLERLRTVLLKTYKVDPATLTEEYSLQDLGVDSLGVGLLLFDAEDEFKIKFTREPAALDKIGDVVRYIDGELARAARPASPGA